MTDLATIVSLATQIVQGVIKAAPIIEQGYADIEPYVSAIVTLVKSGGSPTAEDFATVNQLLDQASAVIAQRAADADDPNKV